MGGCLDGGMDAGLKGLMTRWIVSWIAVERTARWMD